MSVAYLCDSYVSLEADIKEGDMTSCSPPFLNNFEEEQTSLLCCFSRLLCKKKDHCNKFFPFTRRQLKIHDPATFSVIQHSWGLISLWDDPDSYSDGTSCRRLKREDDLNKSLLRQQNIIDDDFEATVSF